MQFDLFRNAKATDAGAALNHASMASTVLEKIAASSVQRAAALPAVTRAEFDAAELERRQHFAAVGIDGNALAQRYGVFSAALRLPGRRVILEIKAASPSKGVMKTAIDLDDYAKVYGTYADAISVLTEPEFFRGSFERLAAVRERTTRPLLAKDFIVSDRQLLAAYRCGADAVLLMLSVLAPDGYRDLAVKAKALGLEVLTEASSVEEARVALELGAKIIGINNRNLRTLEVDVNRAPNIASELTGDLLKGTFADDPRWIWFADHSKSPAAPCGAELLAKFGLTNAEPLHLSETDALRFIRDGRWDGIGLDPKFMAEAARLCDHLLPAARATNCSNILIRETDGTITGDFTIGTGLLKMLPAMGLTICQTRALFLTEEALEPLAAGLARLLTALGAPQAKVIRIDHPLSADAAKRIEGAEGFSLLFNATNLGRAPNTDQMPIESAEVFQCFPKLKAVLDSVDEPVRPRLIWEAQQRGLEARTTLGLRVVVAREAMELFAGRTLPLCATRYRLRRP